MRPLRWPRCWLGVWLLAIAGVIVLSLIPPPEMARVAPRNFDKLLHFAAYFMLAFGAVQLFRGRHALTTAALALIALGIVMEWAQGALMPDVRMADPWDALANGLGVLAAMSLSATPLATALQRLERYLAA